MENIFKNTIGMLHVYIYIYLFIYLYITIGRHISSLNYITNFDQTLLKFFERILFWLVSTGKTTTWTITEENTRRREC
jgi:hypothetical protein